MITKDRADSSQGPPGEAALASLSAGFEKKTSLLTIIFISYLLLTLTNLLIFWIAAGSNQFRLIKEKAILMTNAQSMEIVGRLSLVTQGFNWSYANSQRPENYTRLRDQLRLAKESNRLLVNEFVLVSATGKVLYNFPVPAVATENAAPASPQFLQKLSLSLHLRELNNQPFYAEPDTANDLVEVFIPLTALGEDSLIFYTRLPMEAIHKELRSLITLAISMVGLILLAETIFGLVLFRILVLPIQRLALGTQEIARGNFGTKVHVGKRKHELAQLIFMFNGMAALLKTNSEALNSTIADLGHYRKIMEGELQMAATIQGGILPKKPVSALISTGVYYRPLDKISGDYYDFCDFPDGSIGILIADVSGHGVPAALITMMAKVFFSDLAAKSPDPAALFSSINREIGRRLETRDYLTAFYIIIHPDLRCEFTGAAHERPFLLRRATGEMEELHAPGFFIGMLKSEPEPYVTRHVTLDHGDRIILYTDGIPEATNESGESYGTERMVWALKAHAHKTVDEQIAAVMEDFFLFLGSARPQDDLTLVIAEVKATGAIC